MATTTRQNYEQLSENGPNLSQHSAQAKVLIGDAVATRTLTAKESGAMCQFDSAAGVVYTLPAPIPGMTFEFVTTVTITSNSAKVITNAAGVFILGAIATVNSGATTAQAFAANGTTIRSVNGNGTTTGGIIGDRYRLTALSATVWYCEGVVVNTGTAATPFATT
jgi:hypothetical protein